MNTGIELITEERKHQIEKYSIDSDVKINNSQQLLDAAVLLMSYHDHLNYLTYQFHECVPDGWDLDAWVKLCRKPYIERLTISGAWIAAEIDRLNNL